MEDDPGPRQEAGANLHEQGGVAEGGRGQGAGGAHGPHELAVEAIGGEDEQEERQHLHTQSQGQEGGHQVGPALQG